MKIALNAGGNGPLKKVRIIMNNSYVYIPMDKLAAILNHCCPPFTTVWDCSKLSREDSADEDCLQCWKDWFKDGE